MDKSSKIIQLPSLPEIERGKTDEEKRKEVVDYIIDNASPETLVIFSKQFLTESFKEHPNEFQEHYKEYRKYMDHYKSGYGQLINFTTNKGE